MERSCSHFEKGSEMEVSELFRNVYIFESSLLKPEISKKVVYDGVLVLGIECMCEFWKGGGLKL